MIRWVLLVVALLAGLGFAAELALVAFNPPPPVGDLPRQGWTISWLVWITVAVAAFAVIEGIALTNDHGGDTLTEHIQYIAGQSPIWTGTIGLGIAAFFAWFLSHLFGRDSRIWTYLKEDTPEPLPEGDAEEEPDARD